MAQWLRCCATNRKVAGSMPAGVTGIFHWHKILPIALSSWGRLSLWQKWVPGAFPGCKGGRCIRLTTLPPSMAVVMKSGNLNFLESSGPLQACNGTAADVFYMFRTSWVQLGRLLTPMHVKYHTKKMRIQLSPRGWTHEVREMQKTPKTELKFHLKSIHFVGLWCIITTNAFRRVD